MKRAALIIACGVIFLPCFAKNPEKLLIQVRVFRAAEALAQHPGTDVEILKASSSSELAGLKEKAAGADLEFRHAVIDALMEMYDLQAIEDLFLHEKPWNGMGKPLLDDWIFGQNIAYRIKLSPRQLPSQQMALRVAISKTGEHSKNPMIGQESIVDKELKMDLDDPVIACVPRESVTYFVVALIKTGSASAKTLEPKVPEEPQASKPVAASNPITQVPPTYPEELRRRGIGGAIALLIAIDKKGIVQGVRVLKPLHPYLNYAAVQAFRKWTFEPVLHKGKPVPTTFLQTYEFDPNKFIEKKAPGGTSPKGASSFSQEDLPKVLAGSGDYCERVAGSALDFVCEETIKEIYYNLLRDAEPYLIFVGRKPSVSGEQEDETFADLTDRTKNNTIADEQGYVVPRLAAVYQVMDPKLTRRTNLLCDYQIIRKAGAATERRFILKENGRLAAERNKLLEEKRFSGLSSLFAPLRVIARDQQPKFDYVLVGEEKVHGKETYVIEVVPKSGEENEIWSARIWVATKTLQILKCEIEGVPIDGFEDVLNDCVILNIKPIFLTTHEYREERGGVLLPWRSKVLVAYPGIDPMFSIPKDSINLAYSKYRFFTVETDNKIIK